MFLLGWNVALGEQPVVAGELQQVLLRAGAEMRNDLGRRQRAERRALAVRKILCVAGEEAGREQIAGAGRVDDFLDRKGRRRDDAGALGHHHASRRARDDAQQAGFALQLLERRVEIGGLIQRVQLALIGEQNIDDAVANQLEKFVAVAVDAKGVGEA